MQSAREPLSWLILERYALGELSDQERGEVEARLAESEVDRACLAEILADESELPALDSPPPNGVRSLADARKKRHTGRWLALSAFAAAALALLVVLRQPGENSLRSDPPYGDGIKGSEVALRLISDRQGAEPSAFAAGERFKLEVTCPPALSSALRMYVVQADEVFAPLPRSASFRCGNLVSWPGAFALDGSAPAEVCLYWGPSAQPSKPDFAHDATCVRLVAQ